LEMLGPPIHISNPIYNIPLYRIKPALARELNSVETCTITALDVITAFAVPNPNCPSQSRRFFRVRLPAGLPHRAGSPGLLQTGQVLIWANLFAISSASPWCNSRSCAMRRTNSTSVQSRLAWWGCNSMASHAHLPLHFLVRIRTHADPSRVTETDTMPRTSCRSRVTNERCSTTLPRVRKLTRRRLVSIASLLTISSTV